MGRRRGRGGGGSTALPGLRRRAASTAALAWTLRAVLQAKKGKSGLSSNLMPLLPAFQGLAGWSVGGFAKLLVAGGSFSVPGAGDDAGRGAAVSPAPCGSRP